jgi:beta-glucosidase
MKQIHHLFLCVFAVAAVQAFSQTDGKVVYKDPNAPTAERVGDLLSRMTIEEKVAQLESGWNLGEFGTQFSFPMVFDGERINVANAKKGLGNGIGTFVLAGDEMQMDPHAIRDPLKGVRLKNVLQSWVMNNTRLGIPIIFHTEALHGLVALNATSFPIPPALGSTWDRQLIEEMYSTVALEARATGNMVILAPVLDISRDPRFGRVYEMFSEDPYLVGELGLAATTGIQGLKNDTDSLDGNHVFAMAKHFVHGQPENGTNNGANDFSERTMRGVFLYPFEKAVKQGHLESIMPSYNENDGGIPSTANPWLLTEVLRKEWGFKGFTGSDYGAAAQLYLQHGVAANAADAGVLALKSGLDIELPTPSCFPALVDAVKSGKVSEKDLDVAVGYVLSAKFRSGLFEHPYIDESRATAELGTESHAKLARKVADESIVLLKNKDSLLPLDPTKIKTLAVIGPNGNKERLGGYSGFPRHFVTVVDGIQKRVGASTKVIFAEGCRISEPDSSPMMNTMTPYHAPSEENDRKLMQGALDAARSADVIVLALGGNETVARESWGTNPAGEWVLGDTDTLDLPGRQNELVSEIAQLGKPIVAVLLNGTAYSIEQLDTKLPAIVEGWYLGQETGDAIADVLFGDVNPSGHLPVTTPRNVGQLPVYYYKTPAERRGYIFHEESPLFPFGWGLSYTTFALGEPTLNQARIAPNETAKVSITVTNTGARAGDQVIQMYIHHAVSSVVQPVIALRGFKRIHLEPGAKTTVTFDVGPEQLSIIDNEMKRTVEPGQVEIRLGVNSVDTASTRLTVTE